MLRVLTSPRIYFGPYNIATFYAELGDKERAFEKLNQAIEGYDQTVGFMKVDPMLQPLHDDARFKAMLKKAGLPE